MIQKVKTRVGQILRHYNISHLHAKIKRLQTVFEQNILFQLQPSSEIFHHFVK